MKTETEVTVQIKASLYREEAAWLAYYLGQPQKKDTPIDIAYKQSMASELNAMLNKINL